jgi:hypothetical protein
MTRIGITTTIAALSAAALGLGALALAGVCTAAPAPGDSSAADTISSLQAQGYNVMINGTPDVPLSECTVSGIHGLFDCTIDAQGHPMPGRLTTLYIDTSCPSSN